MDAPGQQRVVAEVDAGHDMGGAKSHLFGFGEKVVGVAVQHHAAHGRDGHQFFGYLLGRVEHVKIEAFGLRFAEDLQAQFPLGTGTGFDGLPQVTAVEVWVGTGNLHRFVADQRMRAQQRLPVELDEVRHALRIHQLEGVHAKALHHAQAARYAAF